MREEKQPASAQSTLSSNPHSSTEQQPGGLLSSGSSIVLSGPNSSTMGSGSGEKDRNQTDKLSLFGPRSLQKSNLGGFGTQPYRGTKKPSPMLLIHVQATLMVKDPIALKLPKMDIPLMERKKHPPWIYNLKSSEQNMLTSNIFYGFLFQ